MKRIILLSMMLVLAAGSGAWAALIGINQTAITMANGAKYGSYDMATYGVASGQYWDKSTGGGLNSEYVTATPTAAGSVMTTSNMSGTFYLRDTGGRGFTDDIILCISVLGPITNDFGVTIKSSGYTWTPNPTANVAPTTYSYVSNAVNQTFTQSDLIYGPQTGRPGNGAYQAFYAGQVMTNPATAESMMFIDLNVGTYNGLATDNGAVKIEYSFTGLFASASFNMYGWCLNSNQGQGINWTNNAQVSGFTVNPVPIPPGILLFGSGLSGLFFMRRKKIIG